MFHICIIKSDINLNKQGSLISSDEYNIFCLDPSDWRRNTKMTAVSLEEDILKKKKKTLMDL